MKRKSRRWFAVVFLLIAIGFVFSQGAFSQAKKGTPNILFIAVDDLRPEVNCYGATHMQTPHIDRLAGEGLLFERAYCQQAICMASRASIMSGIRPENRKLYNCSSLLELAPEVVTLNEHLADQGYATYSIGKIYHHGEDRSDQFPGSWADPTDQWAGRGYITPEAILEMEANGKFDPAKAPKGPAYEMADVPDNAYIDGYNADLAVEKLKEYKKQEGPFFLALGFHKPHLPWCAPKKYWDMYPTEGIELSPAPGFPEGMTPFTLTNWGELRGYFGIPQGTDQVPDELALQLRRAYYASVSYMDAQLGKVLDALEKYGHKENTIVILWGDHGWKLGDHHAWSKHTNFEFDTRVPLIISVPGMGTAGRRSMSFAEFVDVYPTLCDLAGIPKPAHLQGESLVPVLNDPEERIREYACSIFPRNRMDDARTVTGFSIRTDQYRYVEWIHLASGKTMASELYDHESDRLETINVAQHPDFRKEVLRLSKILHIQYDAAIPGIHHWPATTLYDAASLLYARGRYRHGIAPYTTAVDSLKTTADRYSFTRYTLDGKWEYMLYDLHSDPEENINLAGEAGYRNTVESMERMLDNMIQSKK
ncbi:MAG: sulfatase-like hydrolase/transferase [Bacteroidales bacterium]|nr:sulfatase-like hydrolase/transferase [Bacteroidales bacterium]